MKTKVRRFSIRWKILIPITLLIIAMCVIMGVNAYNRMKTGMIQLGVEEAQMAAAMAQFMVNGDDLVDLGGDFENTDEYQRILASLRQIQSICGIAYLYTLHTDDNASLYYGIDTDESAARKHPGDAFEGGYAEFADVFAGQAYVQDYIDVTSDGRLLIVNVLVGGIMKSLNKVDHKIYDLVHSEGDLTQKLDISSGDELERIAGNVNMLLEYIRGIMLNISANSARLGVSTGTIAQSLVNAKDNISDISATMEQMSAAMEETSASLHQVNDSVANITQSIGGIAGKASSERDMAVTIMEKVQTIYEAAESDRTEAARLAAEMSENVKERIQRSKAVEQIDALTAEIINITDQTSLLALNANIEAARAGAAGKGFAVVANEIGALANNSARAAEGIQRVSQEVIHAVNELAGESERMIRFMNETAMAGYERLLDNSINYKNDVGHLSEIMKNFADESRNLNENIDSIKEAVDAVNIAAGESAKGVVGVTEMASDMTQSMENIKAEAENNQEVAGRLEAEVGKFKL